MPRESSHPANANLEALESPSELREANDQLIYVPSLQERKLKAKFWARAAENPLINIGVGSNVTLRQIKDLTSGGQTLDVSWKKPGFQTWFLNADDGRAKLEYLFDLGLDAIEEIFINPDPKTSSAKVNAMKLLAELTGRYIKGKQGHVGGLGEAIAQADKASLEALFQSAGLTVALTASKGQVESVNYPEEITIDQKD